MTSIENILQERKGYWLKILKKSTKPDWLNIDSPQIQKYDVIYGDDSEYRGKEYYLDFEEEKIIKEWEDKDDKKMDLLLHEVAKKRKADLCRFNEIISYQFAAYSLKKDLYTEGIIYLYDIKSKTFSKRLKLSKILGEVLKSLEYTRYECDEKQLKRKLKILKVAHFSIAEYTTLKGRDELNNKLTEVHGTLCGFKPFTQKVDWDGIHFSTISLTWRDTFLLAPAGKRSLEKLGKVIKLPKVKINENYFFNMVSLLESQKEDEQGLFEKYAIADAQITLGYFCYFNNILNKVSEGKIKKEVLTVSGSGIPLFESLVQEKSEKEFGDKFYIERRTMGIIRGTKGKREQVKSRKADESFAGYTYYGGLNTYFRAKSYKCNENEIIIHPDLVKAYVTNLATIAAVDYNARKKTNFDWDQQLMGLAGYIQNPEHTEIGIFRTEYKFPKNTYQSTIPQKTEGGLIYTLQGNDFCTLVEIIEALRMKGVSNEMIEQAIIYPKFLIRGKPYFPFAEFLIFLSEARKKYAEELGADSFECELLKLMGNGFYGKLAQGIEYRTVYDLDGKKVQLEPSIVTNPIYAAPTTSISRCVIAVMVNEINKWPGCKVFNATTDGMTISIPKPKWWNIEVWKEGEEYKGRILSKDNDDDKNVIGKIKNIPRFEKLMPELHKHLESFYPIKLMKAGLKKLGVEDLKWLDIKYVGDETRSEQTRANYIAYKGVTQSIARGNITKRIMTGKDIFDKIVDSEELKIITERNLTSLREIKDEKKKYDLTTHRVWDKKEKVWKLSQKTVNIGFDAKRIPIDEEGTDSRQPIDAEEWNEWRKPTKSIKKAKEKITIEKVIFRKHSQTDEGTLRIQGSRIKTIIRVTLSAAWKYDWSKKRITNIQLAEELNKIIMSEEKLNSSDSKKLVSEMDLKNWKWRKFLPKSLPNNQKVREIIEKISQILEFKMNEKMFEKILNI